jgi:bacillithiol system protein YtxJ
MTLIPLDTETATAWLQHLPEEDLVLLYKHSTRCGVSLDAVDAIGHFALLEPALPIYQLDVVRQRRLSQEFAQLLGIHHASPQVILLRGARPVWHTSHQRISVANLSAQLEAARRDAATPG